MADTLRVYPTGVIGPPKDREGHAAAAPVPSLPAGTVVFSADNHISLAQDIFYQRAPAAMKERVPRVVQEDGAWIITVGEKSLLPYGFAGVLTQYDPLPGSTTSELDVRLAQLEADGVSKELAFPNALLALMAYPDGEVRETCFRIYNEHIAEVQERSGGRFYGVGLMNWWDPAGARRTLTEMKALGIRTFWLPLKPGAGPDGKPLDFNGTFMAGVWEAVEEAGLPVSHHIGEGTLSAPCATNAYAVAMVHNAAPFREMFARYISGGILDRHPGLRVGWFEGGINWVPSALQDTEHMYESYRHTLTHRLAHEPQWYWEHHMYAAFMVDPLGLDLLDRIGVERVMWSTDFPHIESTFGYSERSLAAVVDTVGPERAARIVGRNVLDYLGVSL
jgi:predicted TIM-barrel fold metal-dependent hydrolase